MQRMDEETTREEGNRTLYDRFALTIFTYRCQQVSHEQDAEDLLVEVFLAAFNNEALSGLPARARLWAAVVDHHPALPPYGEITNGYERRRIVVRLHAEGWSVSTSSAYMQTTRATNFTLGLTVRCCRSGPP